MGGDGWYWELGAAIPHLQPLPVHRPAELVAKFMDAELRAGNKGQSDEELEATLDKALMLFRYIQAGRQSAACGPHGPVKVLVLSAKGPLLQCSG